MAVAGPNALPASPAEPVALALTVVKGIRPLLDQSILCWIEHAPPSPPTHRARRRRVPKSDSWFAGLGSTPTFIALPVALALAVTALKAIYPLLEQACRLPSLLSPGRLSSADLAISGHVLVLLI
ncbi:hypothetical protein PUNSTDRAFT_134395 [Punctularia strigosozonata HHB-11173 SS5]|uniref:uncharacterized protein n=1 Tax=Punctularia strigosozonata (strain HHB-11173) TaxID=741275 RepID=UPI000441685D|nr:uncharacterized protein PUNSTDRAFT_134395 [Punctularia strigosozonata HHB-11173 SS5]EIN09232.1 hypothetical protein PUNSTDRAFT_134395 [Punctularia strigosozonata HHB-11173 SS5]